MKSELKKNSTIEIDEQMSNDFTKILSDSDSTPFINLFRQQQKQQYCQELKLKSKTA